MADKAETIRIAIINDRGEPPPPALALPFSAAGIIPVQLEFFSAKDAPSREELRQDLLNRRPEGFDLVLDVQAPASGEEERVISGPAARAVEDLLLQLRELRRKQDINAGIINSAVDAIISINEDHVIVGYNLGAEKILGFTREEALGQDLKLIIPPPHKEVHQEYLRRYLAGRRPRVIGKHVRLTAQRKDGTEFPMSISFSVAEVWGKFYFTGIIRDITEAKEMEERLLQSERLAAVGNTVTHIAHEIKNPLLVIGGFARQLLKATKLDDKAKQKLAIVAEEVGRLEGMVAEMRDFVRPSSAQKSPGDLESLISQVVEFFQENFREHRIRVRRRQDSSLPEMRFDPQQIRQVLINLFKNAVEAMPRGGELVITTRVVGPNVEVSVTDTGEGMAPEVAANIFTPYFTTKEKGTGLGLAICNFIVKEQHGGCIMVESTPGQGSTFTIQLPLAEASQD
jgi:two-component system sensor kinase FixL